MGTPPMHEPNGIADGRIDLDVMISVPESAPELPQLGSIRLVFRRCWLINYKKKEKKKRKEKEGKKERKERKEREREKKRGITAHSSRLPGYQRNGMSCGSTPQEKEQVEMKTTAPSCTQVSEIPVTISQHMRVSEQLLCSLDISIKSEALHNAVLERCKELGGDFNLTRDQQYLASAVGSPLPYLPFACKEENQKFAEMILSAESPLDDAKAAM
ncbi:hypothetical protein THAOC_12437, partial [Thalassiosira oceanica]